MKSLSRSDGRSAVAASAYRAGVLLTDERTGLVHDYSHRSGVVSAEILTPDGGPADRARLWNAAELAERRKDSRTGREWVLALPEELDAEQRCELARGFALELVRRYGVAVDMAIHEPSKGGDERNHHAHVFATTRSVSRDESGALVMGEKAAIELSDSKRKKLDAGLKPAAEEVTELRQLWERLANEALERAGRAERITAKSFEAQGIDREPMTHLGPSATAMERRGEASERGEVNRQAEARNAEREAVQAEIIDLQARREARDREQREREAEAARQEAARKAAREAQARREAEEARKAETARQEAQRAARERLEAERKAETQRQTERERHEEARKAERQRIEGLSAQELTWEISRLARSTPDEIRRHDREVLKAEKVQHAASLRVWKEKHRETDAEQGAQEWRRKHRLLAWLHDKGWRPSARLLAYQRSAEEARQEKERLQPELSEAETAVQLAVRRVTDRWFAEASVKRFMQEVLDQKRQADAEEARKAVQEHERAATAQAERVAMEREFITRLRAHPEDAEGFRAQLTAELDAASEGAGRARAQKRLEDFEKLAQRAAQPKEPDRPEPKRRAPDRSFDRDW